MSPKRHRSFCVYIEQRLVVEEKQCSQDFLPVRMEWYNDTRFDESLWKL